MKNNKKIILMKDLISLANNFDAKGLQSEADQIDKILTKEAYSLLMPLLSLMACGDNGLKFPHFAWAVDPGNGSFITVLEDSGATVIYTVLNVSVEFEDSQFNYEIDIPEISIDKLDEALTPGRSAYQGKTIKGTYEEFENGNIYSVLKAVENGEKTLYNYDIYDGTQPGSVVMYLTNMGDTFLSGWQVNKRIESREDLKEYISDFGRNGSYTAPSNITITEK